MVHVGGALAHRVKGFEGRYQFAGSIHLDSDCAAAGAADARRQALGGRSQTREIFGPGGDHFQLALALRDGGRGQIGSRTRCGAGAGDGRAF